MVMIASCLGLQISETLGLQWCDVDWDNLFILIQRSVVAGKVYEAKTEDSRKPMSIHSTVAEALLNVTGYF